MPLVRAQVEGRARGHGRVVGASTCPAASSRCTSQRVLVRRWLPVPRFGHNGHRKRVSRRRLVFEADAARDRTSGIQEKYQQLDLPGHFQVPPSDSDVENVPRPPEGKREETGAILSRVSSYPRLRYMGSKYRVVPHLVHIFSRLRFETALDPFCGSGVVAYALKVMGKQVTASDYLSYAATVAHATVENPGVRMSSEDIDLILSPSADGRDFIQRTFEG